MLSLKQPPDDLFSLAGSQGPSGSREGKCAASEERFTLLPGARGPVDLCTRMVCSAWLKVSAGSALEAQNIVCTAEIQFSHGWREARAGLLETTWHTPVLCQTRNTEWGVFNYHFLFLFFLEANLFPLSCFLSDCSRMNHTALHVYLYSQGDGGKQTWLMSPARRKW